MIARRGHAAREFGEWASLFGGNRDIFVMIVVYADESGTHDPEGQDSGSKYPVVAGFAAQGTAWKKFCKGWGRVLRQHGEVPYFHSRELRAAREAIVQKKEVSKELQKNPYYSRGWSIGKIESFRRDLARVAADGDKIPIIGNVSIPAFKSQRHQFIQQDHYKICMQDFFRVCLFETKLQWGDFRDDIVFIFDKGGPHALVDATNEVFADFQKIDPRIVDTPHYIESKRAKGWPLQAADMLAYRLRKLLEDYKSSGGNFEAIVLEPFDNILLSNLNKSGAKKFPQFAHLLRDKKKI